MTLIRQWDRITRRGKFWAIIAAALVARTGSQAGAAPSADAAPLEPVRLRCEYQESPLGIDNRAPRLSWELVAPSPGSRGRRQTAYRILVAARPDRLRAGLADLWDSGKVLSSQPVAVEYGGRPLRSRLRAYWTVQVWDERGRVSTGAARASWEMGLLNRADWKATWIGADPPAPKTESEQFDDAPAPLLRKEFVASRQVLQARAYVTGLGYYELSLNGRRVGDQLLDPGWTAYGRRILYSTYDVTAAVRQGRNALGIMLGNGFYNPLPLRMWGHLNLREHLTVGAPRAIVQVEITYRDGTRELVNSDSSWRWAEGPIRRNSVYLGEQYDARAERPGWNLPGYDDSAWRSAVRLESPGGVLTAQIAPPIRATRRFSTRKVTEARPGVFLFDLGQNFAGWVRLRVSGASPGTRIVMRYGELLTPAGQLNPMTSVAGQIKGRRTEAGSQAPATAVQTDSYTCRGGDPEEYTPRFTFHGFRYVEVSGYPGPPPSTAIEGIGLNSDVAAAGTFACSNPLLDRIYAATRATFLSNLFSVQSDCPHREKFGYGGDIVATSETAMLAFDMSRFYEKSILDLADSVRPNGGFTETAPYVGIADAGLGEGAGPVEWGTAHPLLVSQRCQFYGDRQTLREQYPAARRWFELLRARAIGGILDNGISDHESLVAKPTALTGTAFYYRDALLLARLAGALGRSAERREYEAEAASIARAFNARFLVPGSGRYDTATQACQAIALSYGLTPPAERGAALAALLKDVDAHQGHLTTGIFGTQALLQALTDAGRADVAYRIASQESFPSWGWMLEGGATTLWEHWEFSDNTYSHNHPMFGSVSGWLISSLAGIAPEEEAIGFDRVRIAPQPVDGLDWARAGYRSVRGTIKVEWRKTHGALRLSISVPPNCAATVCIPARRAEDVSEGGRVASAAPGVAFQRMERGAVIYRVGSGEYRFSVAAR